MNKARLTKHQRGWARRERAANAAWLRVDTAMRKQADALGLNPNRWTEYTLDFTGMFDDMNRVRYAQRLGMNVPRFP